ncbi:SPOR domain-containing protein [Nitrosomonadales bacterium]|nr:SPOR domain-containing protein [Nitrosomonadales bacterium]
MLDDYKTKNAKKAEGTPFTNGIFVGLLFGILVSIAVTLFITNGKSPFVSKETAGACIEINSALEDEDVINIDEDTGFDFYDSLPRDNTDYANNKQSDLDKNRDVNYYLQVGAFSEVSPADNLKAKLALMGFESVIMTAKIGDNTFHRVCVGPYTKFVKTRDMREKLIKEGFKANLIKLTKPKSD